MTNELFKDCVTCYKLLNACINTKGENVDVKIPDGSINAFTQVKNYLANIIASQVKV